MIRIFATLRLGSLDLLQSSRSCVIKCSFRVAQIIKTNNINKRVYDKLNVPNLRQHLMLMHYLDKSID